MSAEVIEPAPNTQALNECDTNADTCCLGKNFIISQYTTRSSDVYAYDKSYEPIENVPIVTGMTAYDDDATGQTYILVFHEALYYGNKLDHSLINPNQLRNYGIKVNDNPYDRSNSLGIIANDEVLIQMHTRGTKIQFGTRVPTTQELNECLKIDMTSPIPWEPSQVCMQEINRPVSDISSVTYDEVIGKHKYIDPASDEAHMHEINPCLNRLRECSISKITTSSLSTNENTMDLTPRRTFVSTDRHTTVTAEAIAENFLIGPDRAKQTLMATTQRGTRSAILPIARRYRADRMYNLPRLNAKFATDTLYADKKSIRSNIGSQIYSHKCGFNAAYHMQRANNENVGNSLNDFINDYGIPDHLTYDGAAVQVGSKTKFQETIRRSRINTHVSAPRRPNENPAEGSIREVKKRWYTLQAKKNIPNRVWDYGISWVCETGNVTTNSSKYCDGRTPLEIMTGITPDITEY